MSFGLCGVLVAIAPRLNRDFLSACVAVLAIDQLPRLLYAVHYAFLLGILGRLSVFPFVLLGLLFEFAVFFDQPLIFLLEAGYYLLCVLEQVLVILLEFLVLLLQVLAVDLELLLVLHRKWAYFDVFSH